MHLEDNLSGVICIDDNVNCTQNIYNQITESHLLLSSSIITSLPFFLHLEIKVELMR